MVPVSLQNTLAGGFERVTHGRRTGRPRAVWRGLLPLLLAQVVRLAGVLGVVLLVPPATDATGTSLRALAPLVGLTAVLLASAGAALVAAARLDGRSFADYGFEWSMEWVRDLLAGLAVGVVMVAAVALYLRARGYATLSVDVATGTPGAGALLTLATAGVLALYLLANTVTEELLFRAILLRSFLEGLARRSDSRSPAVAGAVVASLAVFGVFHLLPPGGGSVHAATTSAGLGVVFATAYLLTGELSLPIGVHTGGIALLSATGQSVLGLPLPTLVVLEAGAVPRYEVLAVRVLVGLAAVCAVVYLRNGELSIDRSLLP